MTKNIFVTNLKEVAGIKVICNNCKAYWFVPISGGNPPEQCIYCKNPIPGNRLWKLTERIADIVKASDEFKFEVVIETEDKS